MPTLVTDSFKEKLKPLFSVELIEKDNQHFYSVNKSLTYFPGSTTVLNVVSKIYLIQWAAKMAALYVQKILLRLVPIFQKGKKSKRTRTFEHYARFIEILMLRSKKQHKIMKEDAGNLGTRAHKAIDDLINGKQPNIAKDIEPVVDGFLSWLEKTHLRLVKGDTKVASPEYGYGGSLDALAVDADDRLVVLDFKTSNQISDTYAYQVASYAIGVRRMFGLSYTPSCYILRFDKKKPKVEIRQVADVELSFKGFLNCLELYRDLQRIQFKEKEILKAA